MLKTCALSMLSSSCKDVLHLYGWITDNKYTVPLYSGNLSLSPKFLHKHISTIVAHPPKL